MEPMADPDEKKNAGANASRKLKYPRKLQASRLVPQVTQHGTACGPAPRA